MIAYTGVETVSNLAEEVRDPVRTSPLDQARGRRRLRHLLHAAVRRALGDAGRAEIGGELTTPLALPPEEGGYQNDPVLGLVENLGIAGVLLDVLEIYVGVLAATILFIATNAGVIGASRITYSMATYRQLPGAFRQAAPAVQDAVARARRLRRDRVDRGALAGELDFIGTLYSFGATLSFTVAHAPIIRLRRKDRDAELAFRARPNLRSPGWTGRSSRSSAGPRRASRGSWSSCRIRRTRYAGLTWLALGLVFYVVYRR